MIVKKILLLLASNKWSFSMPKNNAFLVAFTSEDVIFGCFLRHGENLSPFFPFRSSSLLFFLISLYVN